MINKISLLLICSRFFSSPMTILSWLVIFVYSVLNGGNILFGIIALIGLCSAHFGTNTLDDFIDYKMLIKQVDFDKEKYLKNTQQTKCRYLINGILKEKELLFLSLFYFGFAFIIGIILYFLAGKEILLYMLFGGIIALLYPLASRYCFSEVFVGLAYGPLLFGGVYYVMFGQHSVESIIISIPTLIVTIILLYIHTIMDYDFDKNEGKKTLANSFKTSNDSTIVLKILLILSYISPIILCILDIFDWQIFLVWLTIPMGIKLYKSMKQYTLNKDSLPNKSWFDFPMEQLSYFKEHGEASFMFRIYQARNLMIYFSLLFILGIFISETF